MKKNLYLLLLCLAFLLTGCSNSTKEETQKFINFSEVEKVSFLSFTHGEWNYNMFTHRFKNNLNDWYRHQDFYEAAYRIYEEVAGPDTEYNFIESSASINDIIEKGEGSFVVHDMTSEGQLPIEDNQYKTLVYGAETGEIWLGIDSNHLSLYSENECDDFIPDKQLYEFIEGKWDVFLGILSLLYSCLIFPRFQHNASQSIFLLLR